MKPKKQAGKEDVQQRPDNQTPGNDQCQYWEDGENGGKNGASPKSANQRLEGHPVTGSLQPTRWDFANSFQACEKTKKKLNETVEIAQKALKLAEAQKKKLKTRKMKL